MKLKELINMMMDLGKVRITLFVAISGSVGYILSAGDVSMDMILPMLGIFILSFGSAALNQLQEWRFDSMMNRTQSRPLPSGMMSWNAGLMIVIASLVLGLGVIYFSSNFDAFLLGISAIIWYNVIYTPLKRVSALAVIPGALIGAIPPAIGWVAAGGIITDPGIVVLSLFFLIWQIPHFWLLLLIYEKDYKKAGFPVLTDLFSREQFTRITYTWIAALAVICMLMTFYIKPQNPITYALLFAAGFWLMWQTKSLAGKYYEGKKTYKYAFHAINFYVLAVVSLLSIDQLIII
jgi:heme o synthase